MVQQCRLGTITIDDDPMCEIMYDTIINHMLSRIAAGKHPEPEEEPEDETETD